MKLLIIMMMFTTVNSYSQTLKQIALSKLESNNKYESVKTGLINSGLHCNSSLKDDDGINNPKTADQIRYSAYRYEECFTRADTSLEFVGNYEEDWAQPAPVPVVSPVAVKDTAVLWSTQEATVSTSTVAPSTVLVKDPIAVKDTAVVSDATLSTSTVAPSTVLVKDTTYVSSDREIAATDYATQEPTIFEPAKEEAWATDSATDATLLDQTFRKK
jgi:hypothetical protein